MKFDISKFIISAQNAAALDAELMSSGGFSIDQLMELAGLSCAQAIYKTFPPNSKNRVLVITGPGNNGGDGLVAARHLKLFGYSPTIYYPKRPNKDLYNRLHTQLMNLGVSFTDEIDTAFNETDQIIDAIFGFSFKPPIRDPFKHVISLLESTEKPVTSIDIPSSWDVDLGPPRVGELGANFQPTVLISLTAPKPASKFFKGRHFLGGRFISKDFAAKWGFDLPDYPTYEQILEITANQM
ncbi:YjeF N-terminal domain-containing protein [Dipodascopsis uninucleata]